MAKDARISTEDLIGLCIDFSPAGGLISAHLRQIR